MCNHAIFSRLDLHVWVIFLRFLILFVKHQHICPYRNSSDRRANVSWKNMNLIGNNTRFFFLIFKLRCRGSRGKPETKAKTEASESSAERASMMGINIMGRIDTQSPRRPSSSNPRRYFDVRISVLLSCVRVKLLLMLMNWSVFRLFLDFLLLLENTLQ